MSPHPRCEIDKVSPSEQGLRLRSAGPLRGVQRLPLVRERVAAGESEIGQDGEGVDVAAQSTRKREKCSGGWVSKMGSAKIGEAGAERVGGDESVAEAQIAMGDTAGMGMRKAIEQITKDDEPVWNRVDRRSGLPGEPFGKILSGNIVKDEAWGFAGLEECPGADDIGMGRHAYAGGDFVEDVRGHLRLGAKDFQGDRSAGFEVVRTPDLRERTFTNLFAQFKPACEGREHVDQEVSHHATVLN